jgi:hypothetical protein
MEVVLPDMFDQRRNQELGITAATSARDFSTAVHRLPQALRAIFVDGANGKIYFARRLNRKLEDLTVRLGLSEHLTVFAGPIGTESCKTSRDSEGFAGAARQVRSRAETGSSEK